jgi:hypothetical protein
LCQCANDFKNELLVALKKLPCVVGKFLDAQSLISLHSIGLYVALPALGILPLTDPPLYPIWLYIFLTTLGI